MAVFKIRRRGGPCLGKEKSGNHLPAGSETSGVGFELHAILEWFDYRPEKNCKCRRRIRKMNVAGIEWCEDNRAKIVGWLVEEAESRQLAIRYLPGFEAAAYSALELAIHRARVKRDAAAVAKPD